MFTTADTTVYITKSGSKYHKTSTCKGLNNAKNVIPTSESAARAKGLSKCSICWSGGGGDDTVPTYKTKLYEPYVGMFSGDTISWYMPTGADYTNIRFAILSDGIQVETFEEKVTGKTYDFKSNFKRIIGSYYGKIKNLKVKYALQFCTNNVEQYENSDWSSWSTEWEHKHTTVEEIKQPASCEVEGLKLHVCSECGYYTEEIVPSTGHNMSVTESIQPTVFEDGLQIETCSVCGKTQETSVNKLEPQLILVKKKITIKAGKTAKIKVQSLSRGDSVTGFISKNKKIATVDKEGKIKAKKAGKTTIVIKLASGYTGNCKVIVK